MDDRFNMKREPPTLTTKADGATTNGVAPAIPWLNAVPGIALRDRTPLVEGSAWLNPVYGVSYPPLPPRPKRSVE